MDKSVNQEDLVQTSIRSREVTYYLVTEQDLNDIKAQGLLGDIFILLESLTLGGMLSVLLTKLTTSILDPKTDANLDLLLYVLIILSIIFLVFVVFYLYQSYNSIRLIKKSGAIRSYSKVDNKEILAGTDVDDNMLRTEHILFAIYFTDKKTLNVTTEIRKLFQNKQEIKANNEIAGDPEYGVEKQLLIRYLFKGVTIEKIFKENEKVQIP